MSPVFTPPTWDAVPPIDAEPAADPLMRRLFRYFKPGARGVNVYLLSDGSYLQDGGTPPNGVPLGVPAYWNTSEPQEPFVRTVNVDGSNTVINYSPTVVKVYWGACANPITAAEQTALTAAGYGAFIT